MTIDTSAPSRTVFDNLVCVIADRLFRDYDNATTGEVMGALCTARAVVAQAAYEPVSAVREMEALARNTLDRARAAKGLPPVARFDWNQRTA